MKNRTLFVSIVIGMFAILGASTPGCESMLYVDFVDTGGELMVGQMSYAGELCFSPFESGPAGDLWLYDISDGSSEEFQQII